MRPTCAYCGETLQNNGFEAETGYCSEECLEADIERERDLDRDREYDAFDTLEEAAFEGQDYSPDYIYESWDL